MHRHTTPIVLLAGALTLLTAAAWLSTGAQAYTKFEVVKKVVEPVHSDDPLAGTGFYENETVERTVRVPEFHLGMFPTPRGLFDKHLVSVVTILGLVWGPTLFWVVVLPRIRKTPEPAWREAGSGSQP